MLSSFAFHCRLTLIITFNLGLNDVHADPEEEIQKLCNRNCSKIQWLAQRWSPEERKDVKKGAIQCCNIEVSDSVNV